ncbi:MAG: phosphoribosylaminoimidazolesuccinocarboxamide synthase, partial [Candidatus Nanopelagicaceae bacterium]
AKIVGDTDARELKRLTLALYDRAKDYADSRGIILVDTKFEFGRDANGVITLGDEALTPDSSRFWDSAHNSFDKQYLRDYLVTVWDRQSEPPTIPQEIVEKTAAKYEEAFFKLTGKRS